MNQFNFEDTLKSILAEKNMTVKKFCEEIGTTQQNMNRIFRAQKISTDKLIEIANYLEVDVGIFFGSKAEKNSELFALKKKVDQLESDLEAYRSLAKNLKTENDKGSQMFSILMEAVQKGEFTEKDVAAMFSFLETEIGDGEGFDPSFLDGFKKIKDGKQNMLGE